MLGGRSNAALTITVVVLAVWVLLGAGAPEAGAVREQGIWSFDGGARSVSVAVTMAIRPAADPLPRSCSFTIHGSGRYNKPDFTAEMREEGTAIGTSTCGADLIPLLEVDAKIDDFGMPDVGNHQVVNASNRGRGPGPVEATVSQDVTLVEAPPPDSYRIEWTFHLHAVSVDGKEANACAKLQALFPDGITSVGC